MQANNIFIINNLSDKLLIEKFRNGDQRAFTELFDRYSLQLKNSLMAKNRFIREDEAEDYVADTFVTFYEKVINGQYTDKGTLFNYLYTIAHRLYLKHIKSNREDETDDERLTRLFDTIYEDDTDKEYYMQLVEQILVNLSIGKNEKQVKCADLFYARYGIPKISDEDYYNEYPEKFTTVIDVRRKRNKCMDKLKELVKEAIKNIES
jgi:DNA-directed RNA polymerase specialized sigma24 family protein